MNRAFSAGCVFVWTSLGVIARELPALHQSAPVSLGGYATSDGLLETPLWTGG
jgi:hypothetical protein